MVLWHDPRKITAKAQFRIQMDFWLKLLSGSRDMSSFRHSELKAKIGGFAWKSLQHHNNYLVPLRGTFALWLPMIRVPVQTRWRASRT